MADGTDGQAGGWSAVVAEEPQKVVAFERARGHDANPRAYVRVWDGEERLYRKRSLKMSVRDGDGNLDPDLVAKAIKKAGETAEALLEGTEPKDLPSVPASEPEGLTLEEGFDLAFRPYDPDSRYGGKYRDTRYRKDARRAANDVMRVLGPKKKWATLSKRDVERIWTRVADVRNGDVVWHSKLTDADGRPKHRSPGWQWCRIMLATLFSVGRWLEDEEKLPSNTVSAPSNWRGELREEWTKMTGESTRKSKPRYSQRELGKIWSALPKADPRVRLALIIGAELRVGQVLRTRRSNLDLSEAGEFDCGRVEIVGRGRKRGTVLDLTPEQRAVIDKALDPESGHLGKLEAAYRGGDREDYPLFPQHVFTGDRTQAPADVPDEVMDRRYFLELFHQLEQRAGVEHKTGRGWYGIRRLATDLAPEYTKDARVLNALGGWTDTKTRENYQHEDNPDDAARAARVRQAYREDAETRAKAKLERSQAEVLEDLVMMADEETLGNLFQTLATVAPERALEVLRVIRADGLKTVSAEEAWSKLDYEDLGPLLEADDPAVRREAAGYLTEVG